VVIEFTAGYIVTKKSGGIDSCNLKESPLSELRYFPNVLMDKLKYRYVDSYSVKHFREISFRQPPSPRLHNRITDKAKRIDGFRKSGQ
jgi:hypothetical protein